MGVYVKSMEMPESCKKCGVVSCGLYDAETWGIYRHPDCPLVEVPTPHGRLCDADAVRECLEEVKDCQDKEWALMLLDWAVSKRTVIEAEDE